jgi:hypothetical protein
MASLPTAMIFTISGYCLAKLYGSGDFGGIFFAFLVVIGGQVRPGVFAIDPSAQHQVHFECRVLRF